MFKQSFNVLSADKEIMIFPVLSALSAVLVGAGFFVPLFQLGIFKEIASNTAQWYDYLPLFSWYYANFFVIIFFNSALVGCANIRLSGGDPTVMDGLRIAVARLHRIAAWTLFAATIGLILSIVEERSKRIGKIVTRLFGLAWVLITYLIVPVILFEDLGMYNSVRRSAELFRGSWGEQVASHFGFGLLNFLLCLPGIALGVLLYPVDPVAAIIFAGAYLLILATVCSAVKGIFTVVLYRYAAYGQLPPGFPPGFMDNFRSRQPSWPAV